MDSEEDSCSEIKKMASRAYDEFLYLIGATPQTIPDDWYNKKDKRY